MVRMSAFGTARLLRRVALVAALDVAVIAAALSAGAAPTAAEKDTARSLMKDGRAKRDAGDHKGALEAFRGAHAIMHVPTTGLEVGRSEVDLGLLVEARDTLLAVARIPVEKGEPAPFAEARKEADALATSLETRIPTVKLVFANEGEGSTIGVTIDGVAVPAAAIRLPQRLDPGKHVVMVTVGAAKKKRAIELKEGEAQTLTIDMSADDAVTPAVTSSDTSAPPKKDETKSGSVGTLAWIGFGLGGAGIVAGTVTGLLAMSKTSAAKSQCVDTQCPHSAHDDLEGARSMATISTISFAVGVAGLGLGVIGLVTGGSSSEPTHTAANKPRVAFTWGLGTIALSGQF